MVISASLPTAIVPFLGYNPNTHEAGDDVYQKLSFLQMAELEFKDGKLICDRNKVLYK